MHDMLCFVGQNVPWKMNGEACPADGCETVPAMLGSWSDRPRVGTARSGFIFTLCASKFEGSLAQKLRFRIFHFQILREVGCNEQFPREAAMR